MVEFDKRQKQKWSLIGGISGLIVGFAMIFFFNNHWGFIPGVLGALLLLVSRRRYGV